MMTYEEARKALADRPPSWGDQAKNDQEAAMHAAFAFLITDIAQSLNNIAGALHSIDAGRTA